MVTSFQPLSSKWCCSGAMRNTRLPVILKLVTWMITDREMTTNSPPMIAPSSSVRVTMVRPAMPPPRAREPVSPMKIFAGEVFHHRKPTQAPMIAAHSTATSSGSRVS